MKKSFTLTEILIVVAILGILAAIILPMFQSHTQQAKESAAKDTLRVVRNAIELYAAKNDGVPPGYLNNNPDSTPIAPVFGEQMINSGKYLSERPENPFSSISAIRVFGNDETFPEAPVSIDTFGWFYQPATKTFKLNWPGTDSSGKTYFDY
jgi:prepilin-type N-terminal cleavage/methylation domain-containing protein